MILGLKKWPKKCLKEWAQKKLEPRKVWAQQSPKAEPLLLSTRGRAWGFRMHPREARASSGERDPPSEFDTPTEKPAHRWGKRP